jgi:hypothetical protein
MRFHIKHLLHVNLGCRNQNVLICCGQHKDLNTSKLIHHLLILSLTNYIAERLSYLMIVARSHSHMVIQTLLPDHSEHSLNMDKEHVKEQLSFTYSKKNVFHE